MGFKYGNLEGTRKPFQVGTGTQQASAQLQADSTMRGFLPPRMTTAQRVAIATPAEGLLVFDTDFKRPFVFQNGAWALFETTSITADLTLYVDGTTGDDANDGLSWGTAKKTFGFLYEGEADSLPHRIDADVTVNFRNDIRARNSKGNLHPFNFDGTGSLSFVGTLTAVETFTASGYENDPTVRHARTWVSDATKSWTPDQWRRHFVDLGHSYLYPCHENTATTLYLGFGDAQAGSYASTIYSAPTILRELVTNPGVKYAFTGNLSNFFSVESCSLSVNVSNAWIDEDLGASANYTWLSNNGTVVLTNVTMKSLFPSGNFSAIFVGCYVNLADYGYVQINGYGQTNWGNCSIHSTDGTGYGITAYQSTCNSFTECWIGRQLFGVVSWGTSSLSLNRDIYLEDCADALTLLGGSIDIGDGVSAYPQVRIDDATRGIVGAGLITLTDVSGVVGHSVTHEVSFSPTQDGTFAALNAYTLKSCNGLNIAYADANYAVTAVEEYDNATSGLTANTYQEAIDEVDANADRAYVDERRYGLVDPDNTTTLSFNPATYEITLTPVGPTWAYWRNGVRHTVTGAKTATMAGTPPVAGTYYIYTDATDGTLVASTSHWTLSDTKVPVAIVAWNDALTPKYLGPADERHSCEIHRAYHREHHFSDGAELVTGGTIADYVVNEAAPAGDDDNTFSISETVFYDEDRLVTCALQADPSGAGGDCMTLTRTGASTYGWAWSDVPLVFTPAGYINWNNGGVSTEGQSGKFYCTYLFATNYAGDGRFCNLMGRGEYATLSEAEGENLGLFDLTGFPSAESVVLYRFVWATDSTYTTKGKVRLAAEPVGIMESFIALQNRALNRPVRTLNDLKDVEIVVPMVGQVIGYNGLQWVNANPVTAGAGPGIEFFFDNTSVIAAGTENSNALETIATSPTTSVEGTETVVVNNNTVVCKAYVTPSALGRTSIEGGSWEYRLWAGVSSAVGVSTLQASIYKVSPELTRTVTMTGTGTARTCTANGGSFWVAGDANASPELAGYVQTPKGLYQITAYTSDVEVTIATPTGYNNESTVAFSTWKYGFHVHTSELNSVSPSYEALSIPVVSAVIPCATTDKLGIVVTGTTTRTSAVTITWTREGGTRYSHLSSPMGVTHEQLQQLLGGAANDHYHVTGAQATTLGGMTTAVQGDLLYASAANTWSRLAKSTTANQFVKNSGSSNNPTWASVNTTDLATAVMGVLKGNGTGVEVATAGTDYAGVGSANTFTGVNKFENAAGVEIGKDDATNTAGLLKLWSAGANGYYTTFTAGTQSANATYTLPTAMPGVSGYVLSCTDAGVMSWAAVASGIPTAITVAAEAADTTCYPLFVTAATGDLGPKTHASYGFNASTCSLGIGIAVPTAKVDVYSTTTADLFLRSVGDAATSVQRFYRARTGVAALAANDWIGGFTFAGYAQTSYVIAALIGAWAGGVYTDLSTPSYLTFHTTPVNSVTALERLRITSAGLIKVGVVTDTLSGADVTVAKDTNASIYAMACSTSAASAYVGMMRARGTNAVPLAVADTDDLARYLIYGYANGTWQTCAEMRATVSGTVSGATVPTVLSFYTQNTTGTYAERLRVSALGNVLINTTDEDGTPDIARLIVKGAANDGTANIFVGRDSDNVNVANLDCNGIWYAAGLSLGVGSITMTGSLGATGGRLTKGWFADLESTAGIVLGLDAATNTAGYIKLFSAGANAYYTTFTAGTQSANATYTLPTAMPAVTGYVLSCTDAGVMSWAAAAAAGANTALSNLAAVAINTTLLPGSNDGAGLGNGTYSFSDLFLASGGVINWANGNATLTHSTGILTFNAVKIGTGGETAPDVDPGGLCLNHGAGADTVLSAKSSDVAHPFTSFAQTDTYFELRKNVALTGGSVIRSFTEATTAVEYRGYSVTASTSDYACVQLSANYTDGSTGVTTFSNNSNIVGFRNTTVMKHMFKGGGDAVFVGALTVGARVATTPPAGTIQWDGTNFQGYTGAAWVNLDAAAVAGANTALSNLASVAINTTLLPGANDGAGLGSGTYAFSDLFLAEGGVINWDNGDATLTQAGNMLTLAGADLTVDTLIANTALRPDAVDGAALGDTTNQWSDLFLASGGVINWANGDVTLTHTADTLTLAGATWVAWGGAAITGVKTHGYGAVYDIGNSSTAFTVTLSNGQHQKVTMTGNAAMTIVDTGNIGDGNWSIEVIQDGTGGRSITSGTVSGGTVRSAGGTDPALSAGANAVDTISIQKRGTVYTVSVVEKGLATWT